MQIILLISPWQLAVVETFFLLHSFVGSLATIYSLSLTSNDICTNLNDQIISLNGVSKNELAG